MISALKAGIAQYTGDDQWCTVRPPLVELSKEQRASLAAELVAIGFDMPGIKK
jgi:4-hydroxy-tetrahydrodipicolinate synthase